MQHAKLFENSSDFNNVIRCLNSVSKITKFLGRIAYPLDSAESITRGNLPTNFFTTCSAKEMLHQGLKVKKLNNFSNFKSVVCELCL